MNLSLRMLAVAVALSLSACDVQPTLAPDDANRVANIRDVLGLEYPYRVDHLGFHLDGGTISIHIKDRLNKRLELCSDGRMMRAAEDSRGPRPWGLFIGADYPTSPGARMIAVGGAEELAILDALDFCSRADLPAAYSDSLMRRYFDVTIPSPERGRMIETWTEPQRLALRLRNFAWWRGMLFGWRPTELKHQS